MDKNTLQDKLKKIKYEGDNFDLSMFLISLDLYLKDGVNIPYISTTSKSKNHQNVIDVDVFFYEKIIETILNDKGKYSKDLKSLAKYGFVGVSRGGKNGLVMITDNTRQHKGVVEKFNSQRYRDFCDTVGVLQKSIKLDPVKLVTHRRSGERMVGVLDRKSKEAVFYETRFYER